MTLVTTIKGLIERDRLEMRPLISETTTSVEVGIEWYLEGELVRRDVWINLLRGLDTTAVQEGL
jgi:hypothetical protein